MKLIKVSSVLICLLLLLFIHSIEGNTFVPCRSVTLRGTITRQQVESIRNCTLILGYFRVLNAKFIEFSNQSNDASPLFPNITEITDYLLVFQAQYITHLGQLLPRLSLIRGVSLFRSSFSLILFLSPSLTHVNLPRLVSIRRGRVLFSRLYHVCYVSTIDWSTIVVAEGRPKLKHKGQEENYENNDEPQEYVKTNLINRNCVGQVCLSDSKHCWMDKVPQIVCNPECRNGCNIDMPSQCCTNPNCLYCTNYSINNTVGCLSCSSMRDLITGKCTRTCAGSLLSLDSHLCISKAECRARHYYVHSDTPTCSRACPSSGYRSSHATLTCHRCPDGGVCKRNCSSLVAHVKRHADLDTVHNCVRLKRLSIEAVALTSDALASSLAYLEHIDDYLLITGNRLLKNLGFLSRLKSIGGKELFEKRYALFVHTNPKLRSLWEPETELRIYAGGVKFFENPHLCYQHAEKLLLSIINTSRQFVMDVELSYNYNGYKRLTCSNRTLEVTTRARKDRIEVEWLVEISDLRRLKGFQIGYTEIIDQARQEMLFSDEKSSENEESNDDIWSYVYVPYSQELSVSSLITKSQHMRGAILDVRPFRWYAVFVKADLMVDSNLWTNRSFLFEYDKVISRIVRVRSLPSQPSRVESIEYVPISFDKVNLKWRAPKNPNGIIEFYFISYTRLKDMEKFEIPNGDNCQIDRYLMDSKHEEHFKSVSSPATTENPTTQNVTLTSEQSRLCNAARQTSSNVRRLKASSDVDEEKNDLISIEDEIYNLAFRPAKNSHLTSTQKTTATSTRLTSQLNRIQTYSTTTPTTNSTHSTFSNGGLDNFTLDNLEVFKIFNTTESLLRLVRQDLFVQDDEIFFYRKISNETYNLTIANLTSFGRYIVSVVIFLLSSVFMPHVK